MDWTEIAITVPAEDVDRAGDIAQMVVPYGIYIEDYSNLEQEAWEIAHIDLIDEELLNKDRTKGIIHVYISPEENPAEAISFLQERYTAEGIPFTIDTADCVMEDWLNNWKKYFKPIPVGQSLLIRPTWEEDYDAGNRKVLHLEPGLAFGTGTHETTRLCMELLEQYIKPNMDVLDVGCGSGILSVAALLLGANSAVGVDIDALAVKTAVENAEINHVADKFTAIAGNLTEQINGKYHIVLANIVADVIMVLTEDIEQYLYPDSIYIMSGIIDTREQDVLDAVSEKFEIIEERTGSCSIDSLASYNLVYRNRLITLGAVGDKRLEEHIYSFLNNEITVSKLLLSIDDDIREHCKEEIEQIFNEESESEMDINKIDIANTLKEFMEIHEYVQLIFNDYHVIFNSNDEKVLLTFSNEENVYVETRAFKLNIKISKIDNFQVFNENRIYNKIILNMLDGTTITLIAN